VADCSACRDVALLPRDELALTGDPISAEVARTTFVTESSTRAVRSTAHANWPRCRRQRPLALTASKEIVRKSLDWSEASMKQQVDIMAGLRF